MEMWLDFDRTHWYFGWEPCFHGGQIGIYEQEVGDQAVASLFAKGVENLEYDGNAKKHI